jgi:hypothetical protein
VLARPPAPARQEIDQREEGNDDDHRDGTTATVETARIIAFEACAYLEKRPRPKKPRRANTTMTMMMIQSQDM